MAFIPKQDAPMEVSLNVTNGALGEHWRLREVIILHSDYGAQYGSRKCQEVHKVIMPLNDTFDFWTCWDLLGLARTC